MKRGYCMLVAKKFPDTRYHLFISEKHYPRGGYGDFAFGFNDVTDFGDWLLDEEHESYLFEVFLMGSGSQRDYLQVLDTKTLEVFYGFSSDYGSFLEELGEFLTRR